MEHTDLRPMTVGEILDRSFRLYRRHFLAFVVIAAIIQIPMMLLKLGVSSIEFDESETTVVHQEEAYVVDDEGTVRYHPPDREDSSIAMTLVPALLMMGLGVLGGSLTTAAMSKGMADAYLGRNPSAGKVYRFVLPRLLSLIGVAILYYLLIAGGLVLVIIPGIIFALRYAFASPIVAIEGKGAFAALGRSWRLSKSSALRILGLLLVIFVLGWAAGIVANLVPPILGISNPRTAVYLQTVVQTLVNIFLLPVTTGAVALLYFDFRIRKEAFDLEVLASQADGTGPVETREYGSDQAL